MQDETNVIDFQPDGYISSKQLCERYGNLSKCILLYSREKKGNSRLFLLHWPRNKGT